MATVMRGWARAIGYNSRTGPSEILDGVQLYLKTGTNMNVTYLRGLAAEALMHFGQHDAAIAQIDQAFALMEETGEGFWKAELVRLSGEAALRAPTPDMDAAESTLLDAHNVAKGQGARALELRAATSLARLWQQQGKQAEGHALLSEIYDWFTEGFDTKDLQDAKALLERLA